MLKLHLPELLDVFERRDLAMAPASGPVFVVPPSKRAAVVNLFLPLLDSAQKYIFDSGSDKDAETTDAVRNTALEMIEAGFFHLPHKVIWIEDPFEEAPDHHRHFYLCRESEDGIQISLFQRVPPVPGIRARDMPKIVMFGATAFIDFRQPNDKFMIMGVDKVDPEFGTALAQAVYSLKKFIVCLSTADIIKEKVEGRKWKPSLPKKHRHYAHTIVSIPLERAEAGDPRAIRTGTGSFVRRRTLVAGYVWGKNTRPLEDRRMVSAYWRGDQTIGTVERSHYVVKS